MRVFLDTSVIKAEGYRFESVTMKSIIDVADQLGIELMVPDVVYEESSALHESEISQQLDVIRRAVAAVNRVNGTEIDDQIICGLELQADQMYWGWLMNELIKAPFRRVSLPSIDQNKSMLRAVRKEPPFGGKNDGYRDYLIWMTILDEVINGEGELPIHFVTHNVHDFANDPKAKSIELHRRLKMDLELAGVSRDAVVLHRSAFDFRTALVDPHLKSMESLAKEVQEQSFSNQEFYKQVPKAIEKWFQERYSPEILNTLRAPSYIKWVNSFNVSSVSNYQHASARSYPDGQRIVNVAVTALCDMHVEIEPDTTVGQAFLGNLNAHGLVDVTLRDGLIFIISTVLGPEPRSEILRMDPILVQPPYEDQKVDLPWLPVHGE